MAEPFLAVGPPVEYPDATLGALIVAQARRTPDREAVRQWDERLTYAELVGRAGALATELLALGARPDDRVGVCQPRTPDLVVAALGVLLAGCGYVPLDPFGPRQRALDIAEDAGLLAVVGGAEAVEFAGQAGTPFVPVPGHALGLGELPDCPARPGHLAHVLFTSGSTGRPKGVLTTHRNMVAYIAGCSVRTGIGPDTRTLGFSSLGFDATTMDVHAPLVVGGSVQLATEADRADPIRLARFITEHEASWCFLTPAVLALLDPAGMPALRTVLCGGDRVPDDLVDRWSGTRTFVHAYGPTESTVLVIMEDIDSPLTGPLPLGTPMPNHRAYVVDEQLRPLPPGELGELLIGGPGIARGYLNSPATTASKFVPDPLDAGEPGERVYRTGDLVRGHDDGRLVFAGRADGQLKIRGQRIELGEVEAVLREQPGVREVAVVAVPAPGGVELVAILTPADAPDDAALLAGVADRLTAAMRPSRFTRLDTLPRNASDKVDKNALQVIAADTAVRTGGPAPSGPAELGVAEVWRRVLGGAPGSDADFFAHGGNSISAMRLVAALRAELACEVSVEDVFGGRTLAGIAERVTNADPLLDPGLKVGNPPTLSPPQRRLWFLDQLAPNAAPYNIPTAHRLRGEFDLDALRGALTAIVTRHEVLRWRVPQRAGVPYAVCDPVAEPALPVVELTGREQELATLLAAEASTPFDLERGPSWRATVYRLGPDDHVLALTLHHSVFDGWSQDVLHRDLVTAYGQARAGQRPTLPPTAASYADYAMWRATRDQRREQVDLAWWTEHLAGVPTVLDLPRDRPRPAVQTYRGRQLTSVLSAEADAAVRALAAELSTTPASVALAGLGQTLHRLTGGGEHAVATVVADRPLAEFDELVGFFVDIMPVRLHTDPDASFATQVSGSGAELLAATAHPGAPLERIVDALGVPRDTARSPLVQVMFNVLDFAEPELALPGTVSEPIAVDKPGSPFDITVYVTQSADRLAVDLLYNPDLFDAGRMSALLADYLALLGELAASPHVPAGSVARDLPRPEVRTPAPGAMTVRQLPAAGPVPATVPVELAATEDLIVAIWRDVLGRESVRVTDNFFDIGGHSLALATVHARITAALGRSVPVVDLFHYPNIRAFVTHLGGPVDNPELASAAARAAARRGRTRRTRPQRSSGIAE